MSLASPCYAPALDARSSERIHKAFEYLQAELTGDLRLSVIARQLDMSEPGFSRFFKRITGHGFIDLMRKLRVQRACRLLLQSEMPVTDICFEVGYNNLSNFNRHFRIEMNQTPASTGGVLFPSLTQTLQSPRNQCASLLAMTSAQPTSMPADPPPSRASSLVW